MKKERTIHPIQAHEIGITWAKTRSYMREDFERNIQNFGGNGSLFTRIIWRFMPNVLAIRFYRVARHLYLRDHGAAAHLLSLISYYLTRTEIPAYSSIGPGCLIGHATAVTLIGKIGRNFTAYGICGIGSGYGPEDVGGGPGCPVLGDNVTLAHFAMVQGPVRVGDNVSFGPHAHVTRDVPANSIVIGAPSRVQRRSESDSPAQEAAVSA